MVIVVEAKVEVNEAAPACGYCCGWSMYIGLYLYVEKTDNRLACACVCVLYSCCRSSSSSSSTF